MKNFKTFLSESVDKLAKAANALSKKADKENSIEAHENASEAHRKARYAIQDAGKGGSKEHSHHYDKENDHSEKAFALKKVKGAPAPKKDSRAIKLHWS
jgi:hypothetical protein